MRYVLGLDAGASKTHALVADDRGRVLGYGKAGAANHQTRGLAPALTEIERAARTAIECGKLPEASVEVGCFCLAGADLPEDYAMLQKAVEELRLANRTIVKNDTMAALRAGLTRPWGIVVICGTGFNAAGRAPDGREIVLPGLGPISGDWGGGGALSQEMIRMVMRAWDGRGKPTLLTEMVLEALGVPSVEILLSKLYHDEISQGRLLDLVPLLFEAAEMGDEVSRKLIVKMGTEVGITANALIRRLSLGKEDVEVILGGGVFKGKGPLLLDTVKCVVSKEAPKARVVGLQQEPVVGAVLLALESTGEVAGEVIQRSLECSLPAELIT
jgi:N-acetylglucosamine kinase-like BadF-type ATPase